MQRYEEPGGRFSILLPSDWEHDATSSQYQFSAAKRSRDAGAVPDAWLGLTWMPPPCDRTMVDDAVAWYADLLCWEDESRELARTEMQVDGRRALLVDCASALADGHEARQLTLLMEQYGIVWQVTCGVSDAGDYPAFEETFRVMLQSLEIHGAWSGVAG